jgi:hypothetical protein
MAKIKRLLDAIFPPFSEGQREKPRDMLFVAHETPDLLTTIVAGSQHVLIILMLTVVMDWLKDHIVEADGGYAKYAMGRS